MKTALCIAGELRSFNFSSWANILDAQHIPFLSIDDAQQKTFAPIPESHVVQTPCVNKYACSDRNRYNHVSLYCMALRIRKCKDVIDTFEKKHSIRFLRVIRMRPDFVFSANFQWPPHSNSIISWDDQFLVIPREMWNDYSYAVEVAYRTCFTSAEWNRVCGTHGDATTVKCCPMRMVELIKPTLRIRDCGFIDQQGCNLRGITIARHRDKRVNIAVCVAGQLRTLHYTINNIKNIIYQTKATAFLSISDSSTLVAPKLWSNITNSISPRGRLGEQQFEVLTWCASMISHYEETHATRFSWIVRLRTDGWYNFDWSRSEWFSPSTDLRVLYTTHCMLGAHDFHNPKGFDCKAMHPQQNGCVSDQFGIMTRNIMEYYFRRIPYGSGKTDYAGNVLTHESPPECWLSHAMKEARATQVALQVSKTPDMRNTFTKINWGPLRKPSTTDDTKFYMVFPMSF